MFPENAKSFPFFFIFSKDADKFKCSGFEIKVPYHTNLQATVLNPVVPFTPNMNDLRVT